MKKAAVISTIGQDQPGIVEKISNWVNELDLNIDDSRMTVLGGEFAIVMAVSGQSKALTMLEKILDERCSEVGLAYLFRLTEGKSTKSLETLRVNVETMDHPGVVNNVAQFFSSLGVNIRELQTDSVAAPHTGTPIFSMTMIIEIPHNLHTSLLSKQFALFCEENSLEGSVNPILE